MISAMFLHDCEHLRSFMNLHLLREVPQIVLLKAGFGSLYLSHPRRPASKHWPVCNQSNHTYVTPDLAPRASELSSEASHSLSLERTWETEKRRYVMMVF